MDAVKCLSRLENFGRLVSAYLPILGFLQEEFGDPLTGIRRVIPHLNPLVCEELLHMPNKQFITESERLLIVSRLSEVDQDLYTVLPDHHVPVLLGDPFFRSSEGQRKTVYDVSVHKIPGAVKNEDDAEVVEAESFTFLR